MSDESIGQMLSEEHRGLYAAIAREIQPLVDDESYTQAIARVDMILNGIPVDQDHRLLRAAFLAKRGELKMEAEDYEEAEEDIRHALHNGMRLPGVYALAGWAQYQMDKLEKAREYFDQVLDEDADDLSALTGRALVLSDMGELEKAHADLTHALHCDSSDESLYAMRAEVSLRLGELPSASRDVREALAIAPKEPEYALLNARLHAVMNRPEKALAAVEDALANAAEPSLEALLLRSHLWLLNGDAAKAKADAMSASNRFPDEAFALVQLAHVQLSEGNPALALKAAERAVKLDATLPDSYLVRGAARRLNGDEEGATEDFKRASQAPVELSLFLFGPAYDALDEDVFESSILGMLDQAQSAKKSSASMNPFAGMPGMPGMPGMGGMDPMKMMNQMFDDEGNIRGPFKPLVQMALKNAPSILKNMPPGLLKNMGGIDPEMLAQVDLDSMTPEQLEGQMKEFAKMMKSGEDPMEMVRAAREELEKKKS